MYQSIHASLARNVFVKTSPRLFSTQLCQCVALMTSSLLTSSLLVPSVAAEPYAGISLAYTNAEYQPNHAASFTDGSPIAVALQGGYFFSDYLGLEARYSTSVQRSSGVNIDNLSAAFVKLNLPMSAQVSLYGLAGYSYFSLDKQGVGSVDESGFSSGIGIHYALDSRSAIAFDFINHANGDEARLNTVNLSFQLKF